VSDDDRACSAVSVARAWISRISWTVAAHDEDAWYQASSSVPVTSVRGFVVTSGVSVLVNVGARGIRNGSPRSPWAERALSRYLVVRAASAVARLWFSLAV
jgi:hypothetical protein